MSDTEYAKTLELQRRAFEEQFGSLEAMGFEDKTKDIVTEEEKEEDHVSDESDEIAESDEIEESDETEESEEYEEIKPKITQKQPKVIRFKGPTDIYVPPSKEEQKFLKSGRPFPKMHDPQQVEKTNQPPPNDEHDDDDDLEQENIKNDIELQRFLKESHLLSAFDSNSANANASLADNTIMGKARSRTLEMRLKGLSSINGNEQRLQKLEKMPIQIRKGMIDKHLTKIAKYEQDAKEGGIILSNVKRGQFRKIEKTYKNDIERRIGTTIKKKQATISKKRQRGLKVHSIGRSTRNGLVISKNEIDRINNTGGGGDNNRKRKYKK